VIDLHCHVLPGLDDGPSNLEFSLAMARAAVEAGTQILVATPHVRRDYPVEPEEIEGCVAELNDALRESRIPLEILAGAEVSLAKAAELGDPDLGRLCLGDGPYLLVESPYTRDDQDIEGILGDLQRRGFRTVLAHPERSRVFQTDEHRLARLVDEGALTSITASSLWGLFGTAIQRFSLRLMDRGLVHDVASDAHDHLHRPPDLLRGFRAAEREMPGISEHATWFTIAAPVAILAGRPIPEQPKLPPLRAGGSLWRRLTGRSRSASA
jgi:protein-tyrosine phosphatase